MVWLCVAILVVVLVAWCLLMLKSSEKEEKKDSLYIEEADKSAMIVSESGSGKTRMSKDVRKSVGDKKVGVVDYSPSRYSKKSSAKSSSSSSSSDIVNQSLLYAGSDYDDSNRGSCGHSPSYSHSHSDSSSSGSDSSFSCD